jgi:hypothetical protein
MLKETAGGNPDGADTFFPGCLLAFFHLPVNSEIASRLRSNVSYVRLFRHECRLEGEDDYYLTTIENAV